MRLEGEIEDIREGISNTPYNKSIETYIDRLKAKLAELKGKLENQSSAGGDQGYAAEKTGDAAVVLVGFPNVSKLTLISALTSADSETGEYEFATLNVNPGMLKCKSANIRVLDVPGPIERAAGDRDGGKGVPFVVRITDIVVFMLSMFEIGRYEQLQREPYNNKIRLGTSPPNLSISKKGKGGINVTKGDDVDLEEKTIKGILREHDFVNTEVTLRGEAAIDELVDGIMKNRMYLPSVVAVNKAGLIDKDYLPTVEENPRGVGLDLGGVTFIGAGAKKGLDTLKEKIWDAFELIRIYMDKPNRGVDYDEPLVLRGDDAIDDAIHGLDTKLDERFRFTRVSGPSAKHDGQQVDRGHVLADEDVLRIIA